MARAPRLYPRFRYWESRVAGVLGIALGSVLLASCAGTGGLRIQNDFLPEGSLRLAQVVHVGSRDQIVEVKILHDALLASGVKDAEISDGSVVLARIFCCGNPMAAEQEMMLYVPPGIGVAIGDIVEVKSGRPPANGDAGRLNTVTRARQASGDGATSCNWVPPNARLWGRVLYCDWMPGEGWIEQGGINKAWFKPAAVRPGS